MAHVVLCSWFVVSESQLDLCSATVASFSGLRLWCEFLAEIVHVISMTAYPM